MKKRMIAFIMALVLALSVSACNTENGEDKTSTENSSVSAVSNDSNQQSVQADSKTTALEYWTEDSPAMKSVINFVSEVTDEKSEKFVPAEKRTAVFDSDGTLYGELFPTYVDQCLMIHRLVHDDTYKGNEEDTAYCEALVAGFENMTYADGYYKPMISLIKYLAENGFKVYINSGAEVNMLRELSSDVLGEYIPSYQVIGTRFGITAENRSDDVKARDYTPSADEKIIFDGTVEFKNLKLNKVVSIINDLGICPLLAFGNSSGDLAMGQYVMQHGGKAYMLLCDDTDRDHGDTEVAASFKEDCDKMGIETVSMKNEFATIYGDFKLTAYSDTATEESLAPAA